VGYTNQPGYLSPYRCTRYHVEQWKNSHPPTGIKETFNHAHAKVRNVIEHSFGVLKMKFRIFLSMPRFPARKQTRIIVSCMALHNFIRESGIEVSHLISEEEPSASHMCARISSHTYDRRK
jgi:hypothetical protein